MIPGITASRRKVASSGSDPYWANVVLLMHMNGNGSDVKGHGFTAEGSLGWTPAPGLFDRALSPSAQASGFYSDAGVGDFEFGADDFTVEFRCKFPSSLSMHNVALSAFEVIPQNGWNVNITTDKKLRWYTYRGRDGLGGYTALTVDASMLFDGAWHSVAFLRKSGNLTCFVDGMLLGEVALSYFYSTAGVRLSIGYQKQGSNRYGFEGAIDEIRITKGVARYTANFTPSVAPFPNS